MSTAAQKQLKEEQIEALYRFFLEAEETQRALKLRELQPITHCSLATLKEFVTTLWDWFLQPTKGQMFLVQGLGRYPKPYFLAYHSPHLRPYLVAPSSLSISPPQAVVPSHEDVPVPTESQGKESTTGGGDQPAQFNNQRNGLELLSLPLPELWATIVREQIR